jgi:hypothetical protein
MLNFDQLLLAVAAAKRQTQASVRIVLGTLAQFAGTL